MQECSFTEARGQVFDLVAEVVGKGYIMKNSVGNISGCSSPE